VRIVIVVCAVLVAGAAHAAAIVIHAGGLLADPGQKPLREQTVVVSDGKITAVENGYQPRERYGADAKLVDLKDRFVLPGLIDLHKHTSMPLDADAETLSSESRLTRRRSGDRRRAAGLHVLRHEWRSRGARVRGRREMTTPAVAPEPYRETPLSPLATR
jgi:predicted amidohydrolase YtcJ